MSDPLTLLANLASVLTAFVAVMAYVQFRVDRAAKRTRLERQLQVDKRKGTKSRSILGLAIQLGISENEIVDASYRSKLIERRAEEDERGQAIAMWLAYKD